jgi:hypothetical protein
LDVGSDAQALSEAVASANRRSVRTDMAEPPRSVMREE